MLILHTRAAYLYMIFMCGFFITSAQVNSNDNNFDSTYIYISTHLSATNNDSAFIAADSLLESTDNNLNKIKVLMLIATLHERNGNVVNAISFARRSYLLAKAEKNDDWLLRVNGFLSSTYRFAGIYNYGKKHLQETELLSDKIGSPLFLSFIFQEKAFYSMEEKDYEQALKYLVQAEYLIKDLKQKGNLNPYFWGINSQLKGICYVNLNDFDLAEKHFIASLDTLGSTETEVKGFDYVGLAKVALHRQQLDKAAELLGKAEVYANNSGNFLLKLLLSETYIDYYKKTGNEKQTLQHLQEYIQTKERNAEYVKSFINNIIEEADSDLKTAKKTSLSVIFLSSTALVFLTLMFIYIYIRNKKQKKLYQIIIERLLHNPDSFLFPSSSKRNTNLNIASYVEKPDHASSLPLIENNAKEIPVSKVTGDNHIIEGRNEIETQGDDKEETGRKIKIPQESIDKLLGKLDEFEQSTLFLNPKITLALLASRFHTNTKYLSFIINEYRGLDFNNYINRLRIFYIVNKLRNSPDYLDYKISYLAEESGFSSHSKFAMVFKQVLNMSPSSFIKHLKEEIQ